MIMPKACFILTHIPNPRINKRIELLKKTHDVFVICIRRKIQNIWEPTIGDITYYIDEINFPSSRHLFKRFFCSLSFRKRTIKRLMSIEPDIVYVEGLDCLKAACSYRKKRNQNVVFYEVADLRECYIEKSKNPLKNIIYKYIARLERKSIKIVSYLVVTSMKFYEIHYQKYFDISHVIYMPNIPNLDAFSNYSKKDSGDFVVGFIGGIRYLKQMKMLVDACQLLGLKVFFAGAGDSTNDYNEIVKYCKNKQGVSFYGKYTYSSEISNLYSSVDCIYSVYDADNKNVRIALPNKLYESVLCGLPLIVAKGTYLSEIVDGRGIGCSVSHFEIDDLIEVLKKLSTDKNFYNTIVQNCKKSSDILNADYYNNLFLSIVEKLL